MYLIAVIGFVVGIILGLLLKVPVPPTLAPYLGIAVLAALDTVLGGLRSDLEGKFNEKVFITGFFSNTLLAAFITYIGDKLGIPLYWAAVVAFGARLFQNLSIVRRYYFQRKHWE
jgi:small basic protein